MSGLSGFNQPPNKEGDYSHQGMPPKPAMMNTVPRPPMPPFPKTNGAPGPVMNGLDGQRVAQFLPPGQLPRPPMPAFPPSDQGQANRGQPPRPTFAPVPNNTTRPGFPPMPLRPQGPPQGAPATSRTSPAVNGPSSSPQFGLPPPTVNQPPPSMHPHPAPQSTTSSLQGSDDAAETELPLPFGGKRLLHVPANRGSPGSDINSEPPSARSSRGPSPLPGTQYDAMEGQFTPTQTPQPASRTPPFPGSNTPPQGANTPPKSTTPTSAPSSQAHGQNQSRFPVQNFAARPDMPQSTPIGQYPTPHGQATPTSQPMRPSGPGQLGQTSFRGSQTTPPFGGQQNTPAFGGQRNTPPFSGQQNTSPYGGQQNTPPFSGQQNTSPYSGQNTYGSNQRATPPMQRQATPPMQGQTTSPMPAMPPMPGQPPMPAMPPMPGQPPMPGMQPMPSRPPMPGQPPMPNQPPAPGMPPMPGQPPMPGMPPMPGQPPRAPLMFPAVASPPGPPNPPTSTNQGITGRRQYPKMAPGCTPGAAPQYNAPGGTQPQYNAPGGTQPQYNAPGGTQPNQWSPPDQSRNYAPTSPQDGANYGNFAPSPTSPSGPSQPYGGQAAQNRAPSYAGGQVGNNATPSGGMMTQDFGRMSVQNYTLNLLQEKNLIPPTGVESSEPNLSNGYKKVNVSPDVFCSTLNAIPKDQSLLNKARLPLGIIIHPFKDLSHLPVIQSSVIVRCKSCRTYINPFVTFLDKRRWKCNLCLRLNDAPEEFQFDPISKSYGDPLRRPEMKSSTIEFIAPSEYMLRPPQPAVYLFLLDVSANAVETGYLSVFCQTLLAHLDKLPGDARTHIGFISFDSCIHFYNLAEGLSQPQMMLVSDLEDVFLPSPDNLLVNLNENRDMIVDLLGTLPSQFQGTKDTGNALGCALQAAHKLMSSTGGRITVMNTCLPNTGPGALKNREMTKDGKSSALGPATDFYKKMALDCSGQQISVDIFALNAQYSDLATLSCASKFSGGSVQYYPSFHTAHNRGQLDRYENDLRRYITRKIGFEAVMRIRCTRGLSINSFHGNFFVRSTDLLSLPNINPDAGFGMQMSIEDPLHDLSTACFQAALLYTSSKGERRIRVHTLCLPITSQITEVINSANQQAIAVLLAKMAVDRTLNANLRDSREAMINAATDAISAYAGTLPQAHKLGTVPVPSNLRLLPLYVMSLLKSTAFSPSPSTKLDERVHAMDECKTLPLCYLMQKIHPDLYPVHNLDREASITQNDVRIPTPPILQLSSANMDRHGAYLLDTAHRIYIWLGAAVSDKFCQEVFERPNFHSVPDVQVALPELNNPTSELLRAFINHLMDQRPFYPDLVIYKEDSRGRTDFLRFMVEDRTESAMSYYEFIQHIQKNLKS